MKLVPDEKTLPRLHLIGTLAIVLLLVLLLASLFVWQGWRSHRQALHNIERAAQLQIQARLKAEMDSVQGVIDFTREQTEAVLRRSLIDQVDAAFGVIEGIHARESERRSEPEVKRLILEALRPARFFDGRGYYFIDDMQGHIRLLPTSPEREGLLTLYNDDDKGQPVMARLIEAARQPRGQGWARYRWYPIGEARQMKDKLSYVRHFAPYDWLIGTGDYLEHWEDYRRQEALERLRSTRFGRNGYVVVSTQDGQALIMPSTPEFEGRLYSDLPEQQAQVLKQATDLARAGGGFLSYDWPDASGAQYRRKTALVQPYGPWGWVLTVTMFDDELLAPVAHELEQQQLLGREQLRGLFYVLLATSLLAITGSLWFSRWSGRLFRDYHQRNLEQQQALREGELRLRTILDSVDAAIFIKGLDFRYRYANRKACEDLGRPLSDIVGRDDAELIEPAQARQAHQTDRLVLGQGERVESEWVSAAGDRPLARSTIKLPLRDVHGSIYALCGVSTDISERKRVEAVLAQARDAAQAANRAKSDFLSNVSHELRTPLNSILGMLHLAVQSPLSTQQQDYLQQVQRAGCQLHDIIVDMLDYASLDSGRLQLQSSPFVLGEMLGQLALRPAGEAGAKGLDFAFGIDAGVPVQLIGDAQRLGQALRHYLVNAIKFTDRGAVALQVSLCQRDSDGVLLRFEVSDSGIGLDESQRARLFQHFEPGDASATRRHGGAGLGLVLVKQLAALMGGEVGCNSQPGRGSIFWLTARFGLVDSQGGGGLEAPYRWQQVPQAADQAGRADLAAMTDPAGLPAAAGRVTDHPQWKQLRERLLELLRHDDVDSLLLFEQQQPLLRAALGERYRALAHAMRQYDFPAALELLQQA